MLVSDLLDAEWERALDGLRVGAGGLVLQVMGVAELEPEVGGDLRLIDSETGGAVEVSTSREALQAYRATLEAFVDGIAGRARRGGLDYLLVPAAPTAHEDALRSLVATGAVR